MSNSSPGLHVEQGEGTETWHLEFPPVNAISPECLRALDNELLRVTDDESVAVVVLTSGLKVFSAGADAKWMASVVASDGLDGLLEQFNRTMDHFRSLCARMRAADVLFIAALGGHTLAGGLELAAACDMRFVADDERIQIGVPEMNLFGALPSGGGGVQFLSRLLGPSRALRFILDGTPCSPAEAERLGLVSGMFPAGSLVKDTEAYAADVARKAGRIGVAAAKRAIFDASSLSIPDALVLDRSVHWDAMRRGNFLPGVAAFVERFGGSPS